MSVFMIAELPELVDDIIKSNSVTVGKLLAEDGDYADNGILDV